MADENAKQLPEASNVEELRARAELDKERNAAEEAAKKAILEEAEAARQEELDGADSDFGCRALERAGECVEYLLSQEQTTVAEAQFLSTYSLAFDLHYLIGRASDLIEDLNEKVAQFTSAASVMDRFMGGAPTVGAVHPEDPNSAGASWLKDVLGEDAPGMSAGRKTVMLIVTPDDGGDIDAEHQKVCNEMQQRGWSLDKLNEELRKCQRPATATTQETTLR